MGGIPDTVATPDVEAQSLWAERMQSARRVVQDDWVSPRREAWVGALERLVLAQERPGLMFSSLNHYVDLEWVEYAYRCTRKDGALGVDGQSAQEYAKDLRNNLLRLIDRLKSGSYRAPAVRRHYIEKSDGGRRGLGALAARRSRRSRR